MSKISLFFCAFCWLCLTACNLPTNQVGDTPSDTRLHAIKTGKHTKEDVTRLIGSPTSITLFEKESWLYIASKEQQRAFLPPEEIERNVDVITFNKDGVVEKIQELTLADGIEIPYDKNETETYGKDLSMWEEMIGNFGRFPANRGQSR